MSRIGIIVAVVPLVFFASSIAAVAQQPGTTRPASPQAPRSGATAAAVPDGKIGIVDTEEFGNPKTGIVRLTRVFEAVNREFSSQRDEIQKLRAQYDQLVKEINATKNVADAKTLAGKADRAESLKKQIERKAQDAQDAYTKRLRDVTEPVWKDINTALEAYARQRGVSVLFDVSKLSQVMLVINSNVDLTKGFVAEYNQRNPAPASQARP